MLAAASAGILIIAASAAVPLVQGASLTFKFIQVLGIVSGAAQAAFAVALFMVLTEEVRRPA